MLPHYAIVVPKLGAVALDPLIRIGRLDTLHPGYYVGLVARHRFQRRGTRESARTISHGERIPKMAASQPDRPLLDVGSLGVWCPQLRTRDQAKAKVVAAGLEELGVAAIWIPGGTGGAIFDHVTYALRATQHVAIATGVLNMLMHEPLATAQWFATMEAEHPGRLVLGLGASHAKQAADVGVPYQPMIATRDYLDRLDAAPDPVPRGRRLLGALGPRMLELAQLRTAGAHTYIVNPIHTRQAREILGPNRFLAPVVKIVLEPDPILAAAIARNHLAPYLELPTYRRSLSRMGYTEADLANTGSDRLVADLFVLGDAAAVRDPITAHKEAGADHVCVQVVTAHRQGVPWDGWRAVATAAVA